ncbi:hypothetical protein [Pseudomonas lundensis]|uniref:hypothetical protein n=1 Tax=Pseudomonas lundensis TaxID=86185 RepID=UPI001476362D|nr:hypothetical protein [Pseudomonas lundensis]NNA39228.1 hypothetical protein [Pseudomonas lundensis]
MTFTSTPKTFHVAMDIRGGILKHAKNTKRLEGMFINRQTGVSLTGEEVLEMGRHFDAKGFEVVPPCDNHDSRGICQGHAVETEAK